MKVISVKQPWASLIVYGYKKYEFRSWQTHYRGDLLIHASKTFDKAVKDKFDEYNISFETGKIIGKVKLEDCVSLNKEFEDKLIKENPIVYGQNQGRSGYAWKITNPELIEPITIGGRLNLWNYDMEKD